MRRILFTCVFAFIGTSLLRAQSIPKKLSFSLLTGYEKQDLKWSIAGNLSGQSPNIYSELQWKKVGGQSITAAMLWNVWNKFLIAADYSHVFIRSGTVTDNDYNGDNRTNEVYNELFDADKGYLRDWSIAGGYIIINKSKFSLNAYAGYNVSTQSLFILDRTGNFPDLKSTYKATWKGLFIKAKAGLDITDKLKAIADIKYDQANYNAAADWNLIQTFQHPVSYRHTAKGFGIDGNVALAYSICKNLAVQAGGGYYTWQTGNGIDELYLSAGGSDKTQLNKVERNGYRLSAGVILSVR